MSFDLNNAVAKWRRHIARKLDAQRSTLEPGDIDELECHLRDSIDELVAAGHSADAAFNIAAQRIASGFEEAADAYRFRSAQVEPVGRWRSAAWVPTMLPGTIKVMLRNFKRQPGFSAINIAGLTLGIACCLIISLYIIDEFSFDTFHEKSDRIYRVDQTNVWADFVGRFSSTGPGVAPTLASHLPEIETYVRVNNPADWLVAIVDDARGEAPAPSDPRFFEEPRVLMADSTFFDVFTFEFVEGTAESALVAPYSLVITESTREKYFGDQRALGRMVRVGNPGNEERYQITGVIADVPRNAHFTFDLLASLSSHAGLRQRPDAWVWTVFVTYVVLEEGASINTVRAKLDDAVADEANARLFSAFGTDAAGLAASGREWRMFFTPLTDIHLRANDAGNRIGVVSDILYIYVFATVAVLIIVLASINFMNLSSARSVHRSKEVGIRKALGSRRSGLVGQFLVEAIAFSLVALVLALTIASFALEPFNELSGKHLTLGALWRPQTLIATTLFAIAVGFVSGLYPALYLSSFNPIDALRRGPQASARRLSLPGLRTVLVGFQFVISILLIACSLVIQKQLHYVQTKNLGFDRENVFVVGNVERLGGQTDAFRERLAGMPGVVGAARSNAVPPRVWYEDFATVDGAGGAEIAMNSMAVDDRFISTLGFELLAGRAFDEASGANERYVVLNESAVRQLPWPDAVRQAENFPLGQSVEWAGGDGSWEIVGVVRDFNIASLRQEIQPLAIFHESAAIWQGPNRFLAVRLTGDGTAATVIRSIQREWQTFAGALPFEYTFLEEDLAQQYEAEVRVGTVVNVFTAFAIFIALLGLFALVSFSIERKTREIGVRKVLGASASSIVLLLSREMTRLVLVAVVVALPAAWFLMDNWLQDFRYRIELGPGVFVLAAIITLLLAWAALGYQTIKASLQNPVLSLRSE